MDIDCSSDAIRLDQMMLSKHRLARLLPSETLLSHLKTFRALEPGRVCFTAFGCHETGPPRHRILQRHAKVLRSAFGCDDSSYGCALRHHCVSPSTNHQTISTVRPCELSSSPSIHQIWSLRSNQAMRRRSRALWSLGADASHHIAKACSKVQMHGNQCTSAAAYRMEYVRCTDSRIWRCVAQRLFRHPAAFHKQPTEHSLPFRSLGGPTALLP